MKLTQGSCFSGGSKLRKSKAVKPVLALSVHSSALFVCSSKNEYLCVYLCVCVCVFSLGFYIRATGEQAHWR